MEATLESYFHDAVTGMEVEFLQYEKDWTTAYKIVEARAEAEEQERYKQKDLEQMTDFYLTEMDKEERYKNRCETLAEYYCVIK